MPIYLLEQKMVKERNNKQSIDENNFNHPLIEIKNLLL